jgi:hypothetical protein
LMDHARDVFLGRGARINSHEGNRVFRSIVRQIQPFYIFAPKFIKQKIALDIIKIIHKRGGKFLQEVCSHEANMSKEETFSDAEKVARGGNSFQFAKSKHYEEVGFELALSKVSQTLREGLVELRWWMNMVRECFQRLRRIEGGEDAESRKRNAEAYMEAIADALQKAPTEEHLHIFFRVILFEEPCGESFHEISWRAYNLALPQLQRKSDIGNPLSLLRSMDLSDMDMLFLRAMGKKRCDATAAAENFGCHLSNRSSSPLFSAAEALAILNNAINRTSQYSGNRPCDAAYALGDLGVMTGTAFAGGGNGFSDTMSQLQYNNNTINFHELQQPLQLTFNQMNNFKEQQRLQDLFNRQEQQHAEQLLQVGKDSNSTSIAQKMQLWPMQQRTSNTLPSQRQRIQGGMMQRKVVTPLVARQMSSNEALGIEQNHVEQNMVRHTNNMGQASLELMPSLLMQLQSGAGSFSTAQQHSNANTFDTEVVERMLIEGKSEVQQCCANLNALPVGVPMHVQGRPMQQEKINVLHADDMSKMLSDSASRAKYISGKSQKKKYSETHSADVFYKGSNRKRKKECSEDAKECETVSPSLSVRGNSKRSGLDKELALWNQRPKTEDLQVLRREYSAALKHKGADETKKHCEDTFFQDL